MNNEMLSFIKSRRSTRKFKDMPILKENLEQILEAGRYAPSGGNNQTTHFLVVQNKEVLAKLAELAVQEFSKMEVTPDTYKSLANAINNSKKNGNGYVFHYHPAALIITANKKNYGNNMADCSCALENMMLMTNALDLGSVWINQLRWLNESPVLVEYLQSLGMAEDERVYGALAVGYPDTEDGMPSRSALPRTGNRVTYID